MQRCTRLAHARCHIKVLCKRLFDITSTYFFFETQHTKMCWISFSKITLRQMIPILIFGRNIWHTVYDTWWHSTCHMSHMSSMYSGNYCYIIWHIYNMNIFWHIWPIFLDLTYTLSDITDAIWHIIWRLVYIHSGIVSRISHIDTHFKLRRTNNCTGSL